MVASADHTKTEIEILLVEDNQGDIRLVREAFKTSPMPWHITVAEDGVEALMRLNSLGRFSGFPKPDLLLLDLKLPRLSGFEVLAEVRRNLSLHQMPVIVLTSSQSPDAMEESRKLGVDLFLAKPLAPGGYRDIVKRVEGLWPKPGEGLP